MLKYWVFVLLLFGHAGCSIIYPRAYLKHPDDNHIVKCGPYETQLMSSRAERMVLLEEKHSCIQKFQQQGYLMLPYQRPPRRSVPVLFIVN